MMSFFRESIGQGAAPSWSNPFTCASPTPKGTPRATKCDKTTPYWTEKGKYIPAANAEPITIRLNMYLLTKKDGTGGFNVNDATDKAFLDDFVGLANWRINNLEDRCASPLPFVRSSKIKLDVKYITIRNDFYWNCPSGPTYESCPFSPNFYLKKLVDSLDVVETGCQKAIRVFVPCEKRVGKPF